VTEKLGLKAAKSFFLESTYFWAEQQVVRTENAFALPYTPRHNSCQWPW